MNKTSLQTILIGAVVAMAALGQEGKIAARKENQQDRIAQGVKSGQLTPAETAKLEKKEVVLNRKVRAERKANGGNLTNNQKAKIAGQQNKISEKIYDDKHNKSEQGK